MFETKISQIRLPEISNQLVYWDRVPSSDRADSEFTNPDPMQNDHINNHKIKTNTRSKSKNTIGKFEYATKYVFRVWGVTPKHTYSESSLWLWFYVVWQRRRQ